MADTDGLTGLSNQRSFRVRLAEEMERDRRMGGGFSLLFMDLEDFKAINDEHGHLVGDEALRLVARILEEGSRTVDMVARYRGEEFVVLLPGTDPEGASTSYHRVHLSAGAVGSGSSADHAMYEAKRGGKNRIFVR